jgi:hypothetical protein
MCNRSGKKTVLLKVLIFRAIDLVEKLNSL